MPTPAKSDGSPSARAVLVAVAAQFFVNGAVAGSIFARYPELSRQVDIPIGRWGLLLTTASGIGLVGSAVCSPIIERFGTRRTLTIGALTQVAMLAMVGYGRTPLMLAAVLGVIALSDVIVDVAMNLQGSWLSARRRVPVMHRLHGMWSLGSLAGGFVSAQMARWDVPVRTHLGAVACVLALGIVWLSGSLLRQDQTASPDGGERTRAFATLGVLVLFALASAAALTVELVPSDWSALRLSTDFGVDPGAAAFGFVAFTLGMAVGRLFGDTLTAKIGRRTARWWSVAFTALGLSGASLIPNVSGTLVGFVVAGLGVASLFPMLYDQAAQSPGRTGSALGALTAGSRLAALAIPTLVGVVAAATSVGVAMAVVALPAVGIVALATVGLADRAR